MATYYVVKLNNTAFLFSKRKVPEIALFLSLILKLLLALIITQFMMVDMIYFL